MKNFIFKVKKFQHNWFGVFCTKSKMANNMCCVYCISNLIDEDYKHQIPPINEVWKINETLKRNPKREREIKRRIKCHGNTDSCLREHNDN